VTLNQGAQARSQSRGEGGGAGALPEPAARHRSLNAHPYPHLSLGKRCQQKARVFTRPWLISRRASSAGGAGCEPPARLARPGQLSLRCSPPPSETLCVLPPNCSLPAPSRSPHARCLGARRGPRTARPAFILRARNEKKEARCFLIFSFPFPAWEESPCPPRAF